MTGELHIIELIILGNFQQIVTNYNLFPIFTFTELRKHFGKLSNKFKQTENGYPYLYLLLLYVNSSQFQIKLNNLN